MNVLNSLSIPFGIAQNGETICLNLNLRSCANGFISGRVCSGKTNLLRSLVSNALSAYSNDQLNVWCVSLKNNEFSDLQANYPHTLKNILASSREDIIGFLHMLYDECSRRQQLLRDTGHSSYIQLKEYRISRLLIVIDDYYLLDALLRENDILKFQFEECLITSRAYGISFVIADQVSIKHQWGISLRAQGNFPALIALSSAKGEVAEDLLLTANEVQGKLALLSSPGEFIYKKHLENDLLNRFELVYGVAQFCPFGK